VKIIIRSITIILLILFSSSSAYTYSGEKEIDYKKIEVKGELSNELIYSGLNESSPYNLNNWQGIRNWSDRLKFMIELDTKDFLEVMRFKSNWYNKNDLDEFSSRGILTRCYLDLDLEKLTNLSGLQLRLGRQRLPWGLGFIWNPVEDSIDTPREILNLTERVNEIKGNDALKLDIPFSDHSSLSISTIFDDYSIDRVAFRLNLLFLDWDLSFTGVSGNKDERPIMGINFSKTAFEKLNLHGAVAVKMGSRIKEDKNRDFLKYVLGGDYIFGGSKFFQIRLEFYHNEEGFRDIKDYITFLLQNPDRNIPSGRVMRDYIYAGITHDFSNKIIANLHTFLNLNDKSYLINPELKVLLNPKTEISLLGGFLEGNSDTEFGSLPKERTTIFKIKRYF
jgi:hypothetical protein